MSQNEKTPEEIKAVAAEIEVWHRHPDYQLSGQLSDAWEIRYLDHLYTFMEEAYLVMFGNHFVGVYVRDEYGKITPAIGRTYYAPDFTRPMAEEEG